MNEETKFKELIHRECGNPAMLYEDRKYEVGEPTRARNFKHLDNTQMMPGSMIVCESCNKEIRFVVTSSGTLEAKTLRIDMRNDERAEKQDKKERMSKQIHLVAIIAVVLAVVWMSAKGG